MQIVRLTEMLPKGRVFDVLGRQLLRSGTSVAANYRAACRAKSVADFIFKMGTVEEEADETIFWIELLIESKNMNTPVFTALIKEANEILAITIASTKTAKKRLKK